MGRVDNGHGAARWKETVEVARSNSEWKRRVVDTKKVEIRLFPEIEGVVCVCVYVSVWAERGGVVLGQCGSVA